ncbi:hypothetical protein MATL_G00126350 [Megalops atlanticus]|uniref:Ig-like domain-containing protein n=1 Tax=Megalops atlanticus TaxID=7932 RepID=A0A9D3PXR6_MEGAT|nr:hypothetical protein MATL_G00126350 [Megalops atlanticus]
MLHIIFLFLVCQMSGRAYSRIWVTQSQERTIGTVGGNVTLNCEIHSDSGDQISQCQPLWYTQESSGWQEVGSLLRLEGRFSKAHTSTTDTMFTITELHANDTDVYYCTLMCKINGASKQYHGNGTRIDVCDDKCPASQILPAAASVPPEIDDRDEDGLLPVPFYILLSLKLVVVSAIAILSLQHCV